MLAEHSITRYLDVLTFEGLPLSCWLDDLNYVQQTKMNLTLIELQVIWAAQVQISICTLIIRKWLFPAQPCSGPVLILDHALCPSASCSCRKNILTIMRPMHGHLMGKCTYMYCICTLPIADPGIPVIKGFGWLSRGPLFCIFTVSFRRLGSFVLVPRPNLFMVQRIRKG